MKISTFGAVIAFAAMVSSPAFAFTFTGKCFPPDGPAGMTVPFGVSQTIQTKTCKTGWMTIIGGKADRMTGNVEVPRRCSCVGKPH